jgi:hypothetical protein
MASDEIDELNTRPPPTTGLDTRHFRGTDPAEMLRQVADYIDRSNPGRMIVGLWCVPPSDGSEEGLEFDVIVDHDEDAYSEWIPHDGGHISVEGFDEVLADLRSQPSTWCQLATAEDEATAIALRDGFGTAAIGRRWNPGAGSYSFEFREEAGGFGVFGRCDPPITQ